MKAEKQANLFEVGLAFFLLLGLAAGASAETAVPATDNAVSVEVVDEQPLVSNKVLEFIQDKIERIDIKASVGKDDFSHDLGYGARWERRVEPSYRQGYTTLVDDYTLKAGYDPLRGDTHGSTTYGIGPNGMVRILYARQFEGDKLRDHLKTFLEKPYTPFTHLPLSAKQAKAKLKVGDFMSLQANLNVIASASQLHMLNPHLPLSVSAYYMVSGEFQVHLFRLTEDKFRIKLIGIRSREGGASLSLGYEPASDLKIVGVNVIDKFARRRLSFSPLQINGWIPRSNLFMIDYVINVADTEVANAYDDLIKSAWRLKTLKILNPFQNREELKEMLLADVTEFEKLQDKNKDKAIEDRTVDRMFRGSNDVDGGGGLSINIGHRDIAQGRFSNVYTENYINATDSYGGERHFYMPVYSLVTGNRFGFGLWDEELQRTATILFETGQNKDIRNFGEMSFNLEYRDKKFTTSEIRDMKDFLKKRLPEEVYSQIPWGDWADERDRRNARVTSLLVFRPQALAYAESQSAGDLYPQLVNYLKAMPKVNANAMKTAFSTGGDGYSASNDLETKYFEDLKLIAENLGIAFLKTKDAQTRANAFIALRRNELFQEIGPGFLVQMLLTKAKQQKGQLGIKDLEDDIYFETQWSAKDSDTLSFSFGSCRNRRLYKAVMYIYSVMNNRSVDLRLIDDDQTPRLPPNLKNVDCSE